MRVMIYKKKIYTTKLSRLESYTIEEPSAESAKVREQWIGLNSAMPSTDITEAYSMLASVETNLLEGVFQLGGESLTRLVRAGFFLGALQAEKSDPNGQTHITSVLGDVQRALYVVRNWAMDFFFFFFFFNLITRMQPCRRVMTSLAEARQVSRRPKLIWEAMHDLSTRNR